MNNVKNKFSIKDLENLTGIKAHTIRIWEKRYNLLQPKRTDTNIRYYDLENFQKLLNVSYLNNNGYKISKIAEVEEKKIPELVRNIANQTNLKSHAINSFKLSMLNFDQVLFYNTYNGLIREKTFRNIFYDVFVPLMTEIGLLWQTDTITPAHEHFLTTLIRQKILINTENIQINKSTTDKTFVLYLPDNEVHELGLMFINYEIVAHGHHSILLGQSVPMDSLVDVLGYYDNITFLSYFTVKPEKDEIPKYLEDVKKKLLDGNNTEFWMLGRMVQTIDTTNLPKGFRAFNSIMDLVKEL
ncbi:MerR family transcriptional regulator [Ichthyenterobacterium sp. W332]|uniref:MerR family transcriptional regulator n=1 Tax=Microcosmobacter mediterraneus TaxID=3075607 RepID=A0ABU2YNP8_9FLAO|nr:MerR family transcriptional regulator [Ichthyenterobacterium sp. W332]MDT0559457.1 MerR family transcriptional regulator [Ichthyenterobacterium sp. W332]